MKEPVSRRRFLKSALGAGVVVASSSIDFGSMENRSLPDDVNNPYDAKGLPTTVLGLTGVVIPRIAIGLGSRFLNIKTLDEALEMCSYALDNGLYYWDTAHSYVNTETGAISE
jgi:hypothetical protein